MKKLICGILMLGTIAGVYGQKVMSLEECRLLALENNKGNYIHPYSKL